MIDSAALGSSDLADLKVVVLAGPARIERDGIERLKTFVRNGGGLLIFPGEHADLRLYNDRLLPALLPIKLGAVVGSGGTGGTPFRLTPVVPGHRIFLGFRTSPGERLTHARFDKVVKVIPGEARVLAQFRGDLPAVLESEGVLFFASSLDREWNDLPTSGAFVPLIHQTVSYLARSGTEAGQSLVGARIERLIPSARTPTRYRCLGPDGGDVPVEAIERGPSLLLRTPEIERPGIYRLVDESNTEVAAAAVNPDTRESDLARAEQAEIEQLFGQRAFSYLNGNREVKAHVREIRQGRELWRPVLFVALCLLVLEVFLSRGKGAFTPAAS
jgi:hypothetical protein